MEVQSADHDTITDYGWKSIPLWEKIPAVQCSKTSSVTVATILQTI